MKKIRKLPIGGKDNYCGKILKVMKITLVLLIIGGLELMALDVKAQNEKISVNQSGISLNEVLKEIETKSSVLFFYNEGLVDVNRKVTIKAEGEVLQEILDELFEGTGITYSIIENNVILMNRIGEQMQLDQQQQELAVSGIVTDDKGEPLPGVNVFEQSNQTNGVITGFDGSYSITVSAEDAILTYSFIGFNTQEIQVAERSTINITLVELSIGLDEVVAIGYGTMVKANVTGAVSTVKGEKLTKTPQASTVNTLVGNVPGLVSRQISGEPGRDAPDISIRGFGSALVIVDGVQQDDFNDLDPSEIETVTVLKDASAAIYGARAGNGVILVTTKRGKIGKPSFNLNSSYTMQGITRYPDLLSAGQYTEMILEGEMNDGIPEGNWTYTPEEVQKYYDGTDPNYPNTDWWGLTVRDWSPQQQHNLSMRGGNEKIRYYGLIGTMYQEGFHQTGDNKFKRYNIRSNVDADITENLTASLDISYIIGDLVAPRRSAELIFQDLFLTEAIYPSSYPDPTKIPITGSPQNPLINSDIDLGGYQKEYSNTANITGKMSYKLPFLEGVQAKGFLNYRNVNNSSKSWSKQIDVYSYDYENDVYTVAGQTEPTSLSQSASVNRMLTGQLSIDYQNNFGKHGVSALVLYELIDQYSENISGSRRNYLTNSIDYLFAGGEDDQRITGSATEFGRASYVGRFNYNYDQKYLLQLTTRYDASPKFSPENRWGFFPSVSLGWRISEESFLQDNEIVDNLKLRLSYSNTGYDATGNFQYLTGYQLGGDYIFDGSPVTGIKSTGLANEDIFWEDLKTYNIGIDYALWNSKLYGEVDLFYRERSDMLATRESSLPNTFGAVLPAENLNSQNNRGFEFMIGHRGNIRDFKYTVEGHVSWTRAKWDHFDEPDYTDPDDIRITKKTGNWVNRAFGYKSDGLFSSQEEIDNYLLDQDDQGNSTIRPGDIKYIDSNGDNVLNWRDQVEIGLSAIPEVMFGLNTQFQYKTFDLSMMLQGVTRNDIRVASGMFLQPRTIELVYNDRWTPDNLDAQFPRRSANTRNNSFNSDFWMVDGSYVRLKMVSFGYSIPNHLIRNYGIENVRFSISGSNLFTIDKVDKFGLDPEIPNATAGLYYPQQRTVSFGINLSF